MAANGRSVPRKPGPPAGVIFGCNRASEDESLNGLFGMSSGHWGLVKEILPGTPCFLFNFNTKELHGVFRAVTAGAWNLDPLAFGGKQKDGSSYPAQVRVEYCPRCPPLEEHAFKQAIAENYFNPNRFRWELTKSQVGDLLDLFLGKNAPWPPADQGDEREQPAPYATPRERERERPPYFDRSPPRGPPGRMGPGFMDPYDDRPPRYAPPSPAMDFHRGRFDDGHFMRHQELGPPRRDPYFDSDFGRPRLDPLPEPHRTPMPSPHDLPPISRPIDPVPTPGAFPAAGGGGMNGLSLPVDEHLTMRVSALGPAASGSLRSSPVRAAEPAAPVPWADTPERLAVRESHAQNFDFASGHAGMLTDRFTIVAPQAAGALDAPLRASDAGLVYPGDIVAMDTHFSGLPPHGLHHLATPAAGPLAITVRQADDAMREVADHGGLHGTPQPTPAPAPTPVASAVQLEVSAGTAAAPHATTVVIGSIPAHTAARTLVQILDQSYADAYDFLLMRPGDEFGTTAVVNFTSPAHAERFRLDMQDASWCDLWEFDPPSTAMVDVTDHSIQGREALMAAHPSGQSTRFAASPSRELTLPLNRPLFFFCSRKRAAAAGLGVSPPPSKAARMSLEGQSALASNSADSADSERRLLMPTGHTAAGGAEASIAGRQDSAGGEAVADSQGSHQQQQQRLTRMQTPSLKMEPMSITIGGGQPSKSATPSPLDALFGTLPVDSESPAPIELSRASSPVLRNPLRPASATRRSSPHHQQHHGHSQQPHRSSLRRAASADLISPRAARRPVSAPGTADSNVSGPAEASGEAYSAVAPVPQLPRIKPEPGLAEQQGDSNATPHDLHVRFS